MQIGDTYEYKNVVTKEITAGALGSGGLDIFATPFLICWMEAAAYYYMKEQLPEGKSSVGTMVNVRHVSPSPIGAEITAKAELIAISENGKMYTFKVEAYDNKGLIGEGTHERAIIDCERFMKKYAPEKMELATRDIVARGIATEIEQGRGIGEGITAGVYLDFTKIPPERIHQRLGQVADLAKRFAGVDITKEPVLISPTCHYSMGGLEMADFHTGETRVPGIYTAGECSCVSVHGANRLGANSLSEVLVFGHTAGDGAAAYAKEHKYEGSQDQLTKDSKKWLDSFEEVTSRPYDGNRTVPEIRDDMVKTMWFKAGVFRNGPDLEAAAKELSVLEDQYKNCYVGDQSHIYNTAYEQYIELGNLLQISQAIVQGAIARKESRGAHTRRDFPKRDDKNFFKHTLVFKEDGKYRFEYKDVVVTKYEPKERKY